MPTYLYRREDGTEFEVFQRITDAPLTEDPETGQPVQRVITGGAGLQFKGSGFYLTDYARKGGEAKGGDGAMDAKGESAPDAKPAATASEPKAEAKAPKSED
ncbi:MAG: zinc ribbon domain-containing protein [Rubricoccaceae bacterium]|nr:zinc ribbon domain-containing protein [Rubricoccaceae bacterium]